jgi:hypothetical protein
VFTNFGDLSLSLSLSLSHSHTHTSLSLFSPFLSSLSLSDLSPTTYYRSGRRRQRLASPATLSSFLLPQSAPSSNPSFSLKSLPFSLKIKPILSHSSKPILYHLVLALSLLPVSLLKSSPNQHNNTHQYNKTENIHRYNKIKEKTRNFFTFLSLSDLKCSSREGVYLFVI